MKKSLIYACFGTLILSVTSCKPEFSNGPSDIDSWPSDQTIEFKHPGLVHSNEDFDYVRNKVNAQAQPWYIGYQTLLSSPRAQLNYTPSPVEIIVRTANGGNYGRVANDGAAAYQLALVWKITGNSQYAEASINVLNKWAQTCKGISREDGHRLLVAGFCGYQYANAAELMRDYSGWKKEDFTKFKTWIVEVFYPHCYEFLGDHYNTPAEQTWLSWDLPAMLTVLSIGVLCDDSEKVNFALNYFYNGAGPGCIKNMVVAMHADPAGKVKGLNLGQSQEMGRDQAHATLDVPLLGYFCQTAKNIGVDLFSYDKNKILALCEYTAKYNVNPDQAVVMPYTPYLSLKEGWHNEISNELRGRARPGWELIYNQYANVMGLEAPYSKEFAAKMRPENGGAQGGEQDDLGFGTLMYTRVPKN
ncbi:alginate lyase family protein [Pedobacter sp. MC2016-24]|uniref:alginate lyase family protein n=1 Tax=Pedobacter sp. MC2016-24 TaxID=2780090 RepID=UPI0018829311|nr:alginate lyase family protein [Pedobacter sp. MC2016-24]MBE9599828.1 alginate lyase family protein [Pedobacter sp. MC2016-24]